MQRDRWELAPGGRSLLITGTRIYPDGREVTTRSTATRVEGESGFPGKRKIAPENEPSDTAPADERQKDASTALTNGDATELTRWIAARPVQNARAELIK